MIAALRGLEARRLREFRLALGAVVEALELERSVAPLFFESSSNAGKKKRRVKRR